MAESLVPHRGSPPPGDALSAVRVAFPQDEADFGADVRVSFSRLENKWLLEDDDGSEWEWLATYKKWVPSTDEALLEQQRSAYKIEGVDENATAAASNKKRKQEQKAAGGNKKAKKEPAERVNTSVYVTGLPLDVTTDEIYDVFKKFGIIMDDIDSGKPRIRMYADDHGKFKGEALVSYFKPESIPNAINILDETDFRTGGPGAMRVQEADLSYKKQKEVPAGEAGQQNKRSQRDRQKIIEKTQQMNAKLADWDDDDPSVVKETVSKWDKNVTLKRMFTLEEIDKDPQDVLDIKEDVREMASQFGTVTNVVLYDLEADGIVTIRFDDPDAASACVENFNGRWFAGRRIEAYIPTGKERFRKSKKTDTGVEDDAWDEDDPNDAEAQRIERFGDWLEADPSEEQDGGLNRQG